MPTSFTYQGQLKRDGVPISGLVDARFSLWLSPTGQDPDTHQIGGSIEVNAIEAVNGLFSTELDFGAGAYNGNARFLQVELRDHGDGSGAFTTLAPRQALTPAPYALQTRGIVVRDNGNVGIGTKFAASLLHVAAPDPILTIQDSDTSGGSQRGSVNFTNSGGAIMASMGMTAQNGNASIQNFSPGGRMTLGTAGSVWLTILPDGHVGIGTTTPAVQLHVGNGTDVTPGGGGFIQAGRSDSINIAIDNNEIMARNNGAPTTLFLNNDGGDVKIGQDFVLAGNENLRMIRGNIDGNGNVLDGLGFTVTHGVLEGTYEITFVPPFAARASVIATASHVVGQSRRFAENCLDCANQHARAIIRISNDSGDFINSDFSIIAVGPR
jgi:hypothetical protein